MPMPMVVREVLGLDLLSQGQFLYGLFLTGLFEGIGLDGTSVVEVDIGDVCDLSGLVFI